MPKIMKDREKEERRDKVEWQTSNAMEISWELQSGGERVTTVMRQTTNNAWSKRSKK
jgi:hypothetical protein